MREKLKWKASIDGYFLHMIDGDSSDFTWFMYVKKKRDETGQPNKQRYLLYVAMNCKPQNSYKK